MEDLLCSAISALCFVSKHNKLSKGRLEPKVHNKSTNQITKSEDNRQSNIRMKLIIHFSNLKGSWGRWMKKNWISIITEREKKKVMRESTQFCY